MTLTSETIETPAGALFLVERDRRVCALGFSNQRAALVARLRARFPDEPLAPGATVAGARVRAYLAGELHALDELAVDTGGTPFQRAVWAALRRIPVGETRSYSELARALGRPLAVRAVGAANARNPISLIIPCHRVIRADGALCGYAGGLPRKRWLLAHEGVASR